ncbi:MAG TPA: tetratricopeptide repeat-containing serine protease family protein [Acidimicrobiia bacterium]|nr:tetratricopeptide repeat-containing serine protease family protein [Acidimicrobiia bacterium]
MNPIRRCLPVILLAVVVSQAPAQERAEQVYAGALRGTALILTPTTTGTGWVIDLEQGLLVTNEHVVTSHAEVAVIFPLMKDGRPVAEPAHYGRHATRYAADVIDADVKRDLAVVRLREKPPAGTAALTVAGREPGPAERLHSIGNPSASGALWVYSAGSVRQVYLKQWRFGAGPLRSARVVETQSPINPGDSGGPVVNDAGELVAVVSGRQQDAALVSWCISAEEVKGYLDETRPLVNPKTAPAFHRRGLRTLERGQPARAVEDLSAAHRLDPQSADVLADRAMAHRARKDFDLAHDDLAEALRLNPRHPGAFNVRGCIHTDRGENDEALKDFRRAIQLDPRVANFHANRGQAHVNKGEFEPAARCYDEALRLTPDVADWHYRRGLALEQHGDVRRAEEDYVRAIQLDPAYRERLTLHRTRVLQVANKTGQKLLVHVRYEAQTAEDKFAWLPGEGALTWELAPGETVVLAHDGRPVLARRMRIWAENAETKTVWNTAKDKDTWTAPPAGYRNGPKPALFTFTFNP